MTQFRYKTITDDGKTKEDVAEAEDKFALAHQAKERGETLISAEEISDGDHFNFSHINISIGGVGLDDKIMFAKNLATMVKAGLPISRGLSVMERQIRNQKFKKTLAEVGQSVREGDTLSDAVGRFPKVFPPFFSAMVRAGEESGGLATALNTVADQLEKTYLLKKQIRGAMLYPAIIISAMVIIGILMLIFVVPTLVETFTELDIDLPASTQLIIFVSNLLRNHLILFLLGIVALIALVIGAIRSKKGKHFFDTLWIHMPIIRTLVKETNTARTARTLSSLLTAGVEVVSALGITREVVQHDSYRSVLGVAEESIQKGTTISSVFGEYEDLYPVMMSEMIAVGEETGKLPDMLLEVAEFYEGEVEQKTKNLSTVIEPLLMIIIGIGVGFFAISMLSPTYSLVEGL